MEQTFLNEYHDVNTANSIQIFNHFFYFDNDKFF